MTAPLKMVFLSALLLAAPALAASAGGKQVYRIDMQQALLKTAAGQKAQKKIDQLRKRKQNQLETWSRALELKRAQAEKKNNQTALAAIDQEQRQFLQKMVESQQELNKKEQAEIDLLVAVLDKILDRARSREPGLIILDGGKVRPITLPPSCDLTDWLVNSHEQDKKPGPISHQAQCKFETFVLIDMQRIMDESQAGQQALQGLKKQHQVMQAEVDRRTEKIKQLKESGDDDGFYREVAKLDALFKSLQRNLEKEENTARQGLVTALGQILVRASAGSVLFVAQGKNLPPELAGACQATPWALAQFDGRQTGQTLTQHCAQGRHPE